MAIVTLSVKLSQDLAEKAQVAGILNDEAIAALLEAEIERSEQGQETAKRRQQAWRELDIMFEPVRANFQAEYGHLTDEQQQDLINQWIKEARMEDDLTLDKSNT